MGWISVGAEGRKDGGYQLLTGQELHGHFSDLTGQSLHILDHPIQPLIFLFFFPYSPSLPASLI